MTCVGSRWFHFTACLLIGVGVCWRVLKMSREAAHARPAPCSPWWADASDDDDNGNDAVPVEPPMKILIDVALIDSESSGSAA